MSLPTLAAFREVAFGTDGLIHGKAMKLLVNTCTVGVPFVREIEQAMAQRGVTVVNCPISGGPPGALAGILSVMISGHPAAVERVRPMKKSHHTAALPHAPLWSLALSHKQLRNPEATRVALKRFQMDRKCDVIATHLDEGYHCSRLGR